MIRIQWNSCKFEFELSTKKEKWIWLGMIKMITIIKIPSGDWFDIRSNARTSPVSFHWIKWREMRWNFEQEWSELGSATWKIDLQNPFLGQRRSIKCYFIEFNQIKRTEHSSNQFTCADMLIRVTFLVTSNLLFIEQWIMHLLYEFIHINYKHFPTDFRHIQFNSVSTLKSITLGMNYKLIWK